MNKILGTLKRLGWPLFSLKNRKPKTSQTKKVLAAQASVLAFAHHAGYDTRPPAGYIATIALVRVTDSAGLCYTLEKMGWELHYNGGENNTVDGILLNATADYVVSGTEIDHVGLISRFGLHNLSQAGVNTRSYALPDTDNEVVEGHRRLDEILPFKGAGV